MDIIHYARTKTEKNVCSHMQVLTLKSLKCKTAWVEKIVDHGTNGPRNRFTSPERKKCESKGGTDDSILHENQNSFSALFP